MKNKRIILLVIIIVLVLLALVGIIGGYFYMNSRKTEAETEIEVAENQRLAEVYVSSIQGNEMTYMETDSQTTVTTYIPVGVPVTTVSGGNTSFSRIAAEDRLQVLFETDDKGEEVIVEIWMVSSGTKGGQNGRTNNRR